MYDHFVRDTFGKRIITDIKYSDVKFFYYSLLNECGLKPSTLDNIHTVLHPTFQMAVRDNVIRNNPASGVMAEIKRKEQGDQARTYFRSAESFSELCVQ